MDLQRAYRRWMWKRLAFLLPSLGAAVGVSSWLALVLQCPPFLRMACLSLSLIVTALLGYLVLLTFACPGASRRIAHHHARALRQHLSPWGPHCALCLLCLVALVLLPQVLLPAPAPGPRPAAVLARIVVPVKTALPAPQAVLEVEDPVVRAPSASPAGGPPPEVPGAIPKELPAPKPAQTVPVEAPPSAAALLAGAPVEAPPQHADVRPEMAREPSHLAIDVKEPNRSDRIDVPQFARLDEAPSRESVPFEDSLSPFRVDWNMFSQWPAIGGYFLGLSARPLPDENDPESWPYPEGRIDGFLLLGSGGERVPGLMLTLDIPFARNDSILVSWTGALLPEPPGDEASLRPNWNHVALAYTRRLAGYSRQATFDLAVSVGACADFFRAAEGISDPGLHPKFAPYAGLDIAFWQHEPLGFLVHVGEALPITLVGSALGMTDVSAQIRWDLSERVSLHGGYRILLLRYKYDDVSNAPAPVALHESLTGPILGVDIRF